MKAAGPKTPKQAEHRKNKRSKSPQFGLQRKKVGKSSLSCNKLPTKKTPTRKRSLLEPSVMKKKRDNSFVGATSKPRDKSA